MKSAASMIGGSALHRGGDQRYFVQCEVSTIRALTPGTDLSLLTGGRLRRLWVSGSPASRVYICPRFFHAARASFGSNSARIGQSLTAITSTVVNIRSSCTLQSEMVLRSIRYLLLVCVHLRRLRSSFNRIPDLHLWPLSDYRLLPCSSASPPRTA